MITPRSLALLGAFGVSVLTAPATQGASWSMLSIEVDPDDAGKVVAAADQLMSSEVGKEFPGKVLLQASVANGADPATHVFVPIYRSAGDRETFVAKLQADDAWSEFQETLSDLGEPVSQVLFRTVKSWGDIVETDHVWMGHAFTVSDPAAFLAALDTFMASEAGKKFPGQVYLSAVVAGGISPVTHMISVGYASEAEMESWLAVRDASADWRTYLEASRDSASYRGSTLARDIKSWGPATLKQPTQ